MALLLVFLLFRVITSYPRTGARENGVGGREAGSQLEFLCRYSGQKRSGYPLFGSPQGGVGQVLSFSHVSGTDWFSRTLPVRVCVCDRVSVSMYVCVKSNQSIPLRNLDSNPC